MRIKKRYIALGILAILVLVFVLGPKPDYPSIDPNVYPLRVPLTEVENHISKQEQAVAKLKANNEGRIVWASDTLNEPTEYCILFLHGFSASPVAGDPVALDIATSFNCNLYMPRLAGHGIDSEESFVNLTPNSFVRSAADAIAVSNVLGRKTIVLASSTGATLAAYLAAHNPDVVDGLLLFSPNIDLADPMSELLLYPWGMELARKLVGTHRSIPGFKGTAAEKYWTETYRTEGLVALKYLLHETMTEEVFAKITQPLMVGYYFENDTLKDETISIPALKDFYEQVSTPPDQKRLETFPETGGHIMLSSIQAKTVFRVEERITAFLTEVMGMEAIPDDF